MEPGVPLRGPRPFCQHKFSAVNLRPESNESAEIVDTIQKTQGTGVRILIDLGADNDTQSVYFEKYYDMLKPLLMSMPYEVLTDLIYKVAHLAVPQGLF